MLGTQRLLVVFDSTPRSHAALWYAGFVADHVGAEIDVLDVAANANLPDEFRDHEIDARQAAGGLGQPVPTASAHHGIDWCLQDMRPETAARVHVHAVTGDPTNAALSAARLGFDAIVVGGDDRTDTTGDASSLCHALASHCTCSVIPVWEASAASLLRFSLTPPGVPLSEVGS